jgi:hypothetical protein
LKGTKILRICIEADRFATRIVGGEYQTEVVASSGDEVGQFESLFEQLRRVFVDVLQLVPELQGVGTRREWALGNRG